jgi:Cu2+-exporting ATPase
MIAEAVDILEDRDVAIACAHCAQPVPAGLVEGGGAEQFCCAGCRAVYESIRACGLDSYYRLRGAADAALKPARPSADSFAAFDAAAFENMYVARNADGTLGVDLVLEGVTCAACVWLVERLPRVVEGVLEARLSLRQSTVRVTWDPARVALSRVARTLDQFGYTPHAAKGAGRETAFRRDERRRLVRLGVAGALMGNTMLLAFALYAGESSGRGGMGHDFRTFFRLASGALGVLALCWPGAVFFRSAYAALRTRTLNLDVPIALALVVGGVAGVVNLALDRGEIYFDSLSVLVFLLLVGRWVQYRQQRRADAAVELLFSLTPSTCHVVDGGGRVADAPVEAVGRGDTVEVRSGELIPADGVVVAGRSAVNQALLTGESLPAEVGPGDAVHAGAQNVGSPLRVRVEQTGRDTRVGELMRLVERGINEKPAIVQFADRVGAWFVLAVTLVAAGTFGYWYPAGVPRAIDHTVALLIVTCPCVLGLATPLTVAIAVGRLARADILVKSGGALEKLGGGGGGRLLLDKTGTLTAGRLRLLEWVGDPSVRGDVVAVERRSNHPIARALVAQLEGEHGGDAVTATDVGERHDGGISARVGQRRLHVGSPAFIARHATVPQALEAARERHEAAGVTVVGVAVDGRCVALAVLGDRVRPESRAAVASLARCGWAASILSGDGTAVVRDVAQAVGVPAERARGHVSPEEKLAAVRAAGPRVVTVMVGDGVNDAAALAAADVGIAVHGGAEASLAAADVYVARPGLAPLTELFATARGAMRVIRRNLLVSLAYNVLAGTLAAAGVMSPLLAAIIMPASSATVLTCAVVSIRAIKPQATGASWK